MIFGKNQYVRDLEDENRQCQADRDTVRSLNDSLPIISFTPQGDIIAASSTFLACIGYTLAQIKGQHHRMLCMDEEARSQEYSRFWADLARGQIQRGTFKRKKSNGEFVWLEATYTPVKNSRNEVVSVVKIAYDVTQQRQEYELVRGVYDAIDRSSAVIEFEPDGTIITANQNFLQTVGGSLEQIAGKHHRIFCTDEFYNQHPNFWQDLASGQFSSGSFERRTLSGDELWIEATYNPIFGTDGKVFKIVKVATNITEQVKEKRAIANTSDLSVSTAEQTMQIAKEGVNLLEESVKKSGRVLEEVDGTNQILKKLSEQSGSIQAIVSTISSIADQTNLLALNAAIEAARAGDQGRGFAVVADEVRQLASRTSQSTTEIESVVNENKVLSSSAVEKMLSVIESVELGNQQLTQVSDVMKEIRAGAENISKVAAGLVK